MDLTSPFSLIVFIATSSVPILLVILAIIFVASLKRMAVAQEQAAKAQAELVKQLANISIELRHMSNDKR